MASYVPRFIRHHITKYLPATFSSCEVENIARKRHNQVNQRKDKICFTVIQKDFYQIVLENW